MPKKVGIFSRDHLGALSAIRRRRRRGRPAAPAESYESARRRKERALANLRELQEGRERRELVDVAIARRIFRALGSHWRDAILASVPALASEILAAGGEPLAIEAAIDRALRAKLSELSERPLPPDLMERLEAEEVRGAG